ncbi:MAG: hypothetical protein Q9199_007348 [Rusavskia elegans]
MNGSQETEPPIVGRMYTVSLKPGETDAELLVKAKKAIEDVGGRMLRVCFPIRGFVYQIPEAKDNPIDTSEKEWKALDVVFEGNINAQMSPPPKKPSKKGKRMQSAFSPEDICFVTPPTSKRPLEYKDPDFWAPHYH